MSRSASFSNRPKAVGIAILRPMTPGEYPSSQWLLVGWPPPATSRMRFSGRPECGHGSSAMLARGRVSIGFDPNIGAATAQLLARRFRVLPQELADRLLGPAECGHRVGDYRRQDQDTRRTLAVADEPAEIGRS